jgi:hypothetical protein
VASEVGLAEDARGVCGVIELDALVETLEALSLMVVLDAGSAYTISNAYASSC